MASTLKEIYMHYAPEGEEPPRALLSFLELQSKYRQRAMKLKMEGLTHSEIAKKLGKKSHGAIGVTIRDTVLSMRKKALGLPRYHLIGRPLGAGYGKVKS